MSDPDQHPRNSFNKQMQVPQETAFSNASQPASGAMQPIHHATEPMEGVIEHALQPADGVALGVAPHPQSNADERSFPQQNGSANQGAYLQSGRVGTASPPTTGPVAYNQSPQGIIFSQQPFPPNPYQQHIVNNYANNTSGAQEGQDMACTQAPASVMGAFQNSASQLSGQLRQMQAFDAHKESGSQANAATQDLAGAADAPKATHHRSESMEGIVNNMPQPQNRAFEQITPSESHESNSNYRQSSDDPDSASSSSKSTKNGQGDGITAETLRELRDVAYTIAHPPKSAFLNHRIIRSFLRKQFPKHFRADRRIIKVNSPLVVVGWERLNISETMWKSMIDDSADRPEMPMEIGLRQIVRCDEQHSLEDHSPAGTTSVTCAKCPGQKFDSEKSPKSPYMMCLACIGQHEKVLAEHNTMFADLIRGSAWARLCEDCQEKCHQFDKPCTCEWAVPLCLEHRRTHLEELVSLAKKKGYMGEKVDAATKFTDPEISSREIGDPNLADPDLAAHAFRPWCGHCWESEATTGISYAWKCFMCMGYFVLPNDVPSTWFPHMAPPRKDRNYEEETEEPSQEGSSMSTDFDFTL